MYKVSSTFVYSSFSFGGHMFYFLLSKYFEIWDIRLYDKYIFAYMNIYNWVRNFWDVPKGIIYPLSRMRVKVPSQSCQDLMQSVFLIFIFLVKILNVWGSFCLCFHRWWDILVDLLINLLFWDNHRFTAWLWIIGSHYQESSCGFYVPFSPMVMKAYGVFKNTYLSKFNEKSTETKLSLITPWALPSVRWVKLPLSLADSY